MQSFRLLLLLTITCLPCAVAQKPLPGVDTDFLTYSGLIVDNQMDAALDYTPAKLFTIVPRSVMIRVFESMLTSTDYDIALELPVLRAFETPFDKEGVNYQVFTYSQSLNMRFKPDPDNPELTATETALQQEMYLEALIEIYVKDAVTYNKETDFFEINTVKRCLGIQEKEAANWTFIVLEADKKELVKKILPESIVNKIY